MGSVGAERQPGGPCWCPVGASRRRAGPQILPQRILFRNCARPGPVRLLRRAGPRHGQPAWRTGGTVVSGWAEIIGVSRRRNARFFWASRFGRGPDSENTEKHCVFSFLNLNLNLKRSRPFGPLLKKRFLDGQGGSRAPAGVHQNAARW